MSMLGSPFEYLSKHVIVVFFVRGMATVEASKVAHPLKDEVFPDKDLAELRKKMFNYIRFTFADINGVSRSKTIPKEHVSDFLEKGVALFAGSVALGPRAEISPLKEVEDTNFSNAYVRPMPGTLHSLPWASTADRHSGYRVGELLCETFWIPPYRDGGHQVACPRYLARRQLGRLFDLGFELYSAFEAEFCVYEKDGVTPVFSGLDIFSSLLMDQHGTYLCDMERQLRESGVDIIALQTEYGPGQFEMALQPSYGVLGADRMFSLKGGVKAMSHQKERVATFMTRPDPKASGCASALHFNHSLCLTQSQARENKFHDPNDPDGLSEVARHWLAGLVKHSRALTTLCSPTLSCYRRLCNPFTPSKGDWGIDDRRSAFRVKNLGPSETYVENRLASSAANPYLVLAGTVAAGIDGIVNRLECPSSAEQRKGKEHESGPVLPKSLEEALTCLEEDEVMKEALGEEFIRWFTTIKRNCEVDMMKGIGFDSQEAYDVERALYFEFL